MIHDPEVLILDEPTTGLDPNQIVEVRNLITEIGKDKTIMLSTHIMQEVEAICERVIIVNKGKIVADEKAEGIASLKPGAEVIITVEFDKPFEIQQLESIEGVNTINQQGKKLLISVEATVDIRPDIFRFAVDNGLILLEMSQEERGLESVFHELTM